MDLYGLSDLCEGDICENFTKAFKLDTMGYRVISYGGKGQTGIVLNLVDVHKNSYVAKCTNAKNPHTFADSRNGVHMQSSLSDLQYPAGSSVPPLTAVKMITVHNGAQFLVTVMPRLHGVVFKDFLDDENVSDNDKVRYWKRLRSMFDTLHDHGFLHNDLTASNMIVDKEKDMVHLIDFDLTEYDDSGFNPQGKGAKDSAYIRQLDRYVIRRYGNDPNYDQ